VGFDSHPPTLSVAISITLKPNVFSDSYIDQQQALVVLWIHWRIRRE
jgi:hypothetical protein